MLDLGTESLETKTKKTLRGREKLDKVELTFAIHNQGAAEHNIADMLAFLHGDLFLEKKLEDNYKEEWDQSLILWQLQKEQIEKMWKNFKNKNTILKASK